MPTTSLVGSISVSALSNTGRVVGVYTDAATNMLHVFWFNGTTVSYFGNYSSDGFPILAVALNDVNQAVVAFNAASAGVYTSSLVSCAGTAC